MFKNIEVGCSEGSEISLRWEWGKSENDAPDCWVFYCSLPENKLLNKGLFLENEILAYFNDNVVKIFTPNVRQELENYHTRYLESSYLSRFQQVSADRENKKISIPTGAKNHIFLVCVYDDNEVVFRIISNGKNECIPFSIVKQGIFQALLTHLNFGSEKRRAIKLDCNDMRKKVVRYRNGKSVLFSVLPEGRELYYFDQSVDLTRIKIYYLSSLIGQSNISKESYSL